MNIGAIQQFAGRSEFGIKFNEGFDAAFGVGDQRAGAHRAFTCKCLQGSGYAIGPPAAVTQFLPFRVHFRQFVFRYVERVPFQLLELEQVESGCPVCVGGQQLVEVLLQ